MTSLVTDDSFRDSWTLTLPMLRHRTTIRKLAGYLLIAWLFSFGAGVVHACGLSFRVAASDHVLDLSSAAAVDSHAESGPHGHGHADDVGKATCVKFCDQAKAVANSLQPADDHLATALHASSAMLRVRDEPLVVASTNARARWQTVRPRVPIPIAYLRLTL